MSYKLHVVKTEDFLRLDAHGNLDFQQSQRALSELARVCIEQGVDCALLDIREQRPEDSPLTTSDIYNLAKAFHETGFRKGHRVAILHRYRSGERAELFAMLTKHDGWTVETFESFEEAMEWFATSHPLE